MSSFRDMRQSARLDALEHRVAALMDRLGVPDPVADAPPGVSTQVVELARAGRMMQAIQAHIKETGVDLKTASEAVAAVAAG
jgi:hypothetical protein